MTAIASDPARLETLIARLDEARQRTRDLVAPLSDDDLRRQHDPLMSPILWDLGHIAHFEELWLTQNLDGPIRFAEMPGMYNPFEHPRRVRGELVYPTREECLALMQEIRGRVLHRLSSLVLDPLNPLLREGYVLEMVLQHEYQHNETILQTLQLKSGGPYRPLHPMALPEAGMAIPRGVMVRFPGGTATVGTSDRIAAYDNERPRHEVDLAPFQIDVAPVRNGEFIEFMEDGGYAQRDLWTDEGWAWLQESRVRAPKYWRRAEGTWLTRSMDRDGPVDPDHPVCHVCYHEARAYATWSGKRLPTEQEWEVAATWDAEAGSAREFPWGATPVSPELANVDQLGFGTAAVGAYPANVSPLGCVGMIGDVWEWTASDFGGYPGFEPFPYPEYSEVFFGSEYKVLRGGSWATRPAVARPTFRNWDYPIRRQIFAGFRCARDD
jgi:iron(II)-dependent oxidoreductase